MVAAGTAVRVEVVGEKELRRKLDRAGGDSLKAMGEGLELGAQVIVGAAIQNIRDKDIIDTGNLMNSVQSWRPLYEGENVSVDIGTPVEYGTYHEFGTVYMGARPWLRPAFDENIDKARAVVGASLQRRLDSMKGSAT